METKHPSRQRKETELTSPAGTPFYFTVRISYSDLPDKQACDFEITETGPEDKTTKTCHYHLADRLHAAYLSLFEKLSIDFGLRLPRNKQPVEEHFFKAAYRDVLTTNLDSRMLYGYGDPAILHVTETDDHEEEGYYLVTTSNDAPDAFPLLHSKNLIDWQCIGYVFPYGQKPTWATEGEGISDYWAPEIHKVNNEYRIYFVAREKESLELCIGMARSEKPGGPYLADATPLLKGNVIDPHLFVENGKAYLYWKEDNNDVWPRLLLDLLYKHPALITTIFTAIEDQRTASMIVTIWPWAQQLEPMERFQCIQVFIETVIAGYKEFYDHLRSLLQSMPEEMQEAVRSILHYMKTPMFAQPLSADGSSLVGERTKIIENDLAWEAHLVEGMWITKQQNRYYLFYAGNDFSTSQYGIGVAIADSPLGPFKKMEKQLLQSTDKWWAPGHPSLTKDKEGQPHLYLHAFVPHEAGYKKFRALLSIPVFFTEDEVYIK